MLRSAMNFSLDMTVLSPYKGETMLAGEKIRILQTLRANAVVVFAALLLASLQLTAATHQFDHTENDIGDICSFCLQLDRLDDISATNHAEADGQTAFQGYAAHPLSHTEVRRPVFSQPRAPPLS